MSFKFNHLKRQIIAYEPTVRQCAWLNAGFVIMRGKERGRKGSWGGGEIMFSRATRITTSSSDHQLPADLRPFSLRKEQILSRATKPYRQLYLGDCSRSHGPYNQSWTE